MSKTLRILGGIIGVILMGLIIFLNTGVTLPSNADEVVDEVLSGELPEIVTGETGYAKSGDLDIWYEKMVPEDTIKGTVLLVMGHSSTAMLWPLDFCHLLMDSGYQVIRYDNRDVGLSTWIDDWDKNDPYSLEDMAKDGIAVLDAVGVNKAHVVGTSMGGMIGQRMAISHSDRVSTLTSIMSSGYMMDPDIAPVSTELSMDFGRITLKYLLFPSERRSMKFFLGVQQVLKGNGGYVDNTKSAATVMLYELRKRKGMNRDAVMQHSEAIEISGSRYDELGKITAPTLAIHSKSDPLVIFDHAQKYVPMIRGCDTLYFDGMGHDMPDEFIPEMVEGILNNISRSEI